MKWFVFFILFFTSCSIDFKQYENRTMPKPIEEKKQDTVKIKQDTIKKELPKKPSNSSKRQYYYHMKINQYRRNPVT